eukprot:6536307-Prymnesium_polylepis.1
MARVALIWHLPSPPQMSSELAWQSKETEKLIRKNDKLIADPQERQAHVATAIPPAVPSDVWPPLGVATPLPPALPSDCSPPLGSCLIR